jgi:hypothetical protein
LNNGVIPDVEIITEGSGQHTTKYQ